MFSRPCHQFTLHPLIAAAILWCCVVPAVTAASDKSHAEPGRETVQPHQLEMLDLAFDVATDLPATPFIQERARQQEAVFHAALKLDQPERALKYLVRIDNWRRGAAYADYAHHLLKQDPAADVQRYIVLAEEVARHVDQQWHGDVIRVKVARVRRLLGEDKDITLTRNEVDPGDREELWEADALAATAETFDEEVKKLTRRAKEANYDVRSSVLNVLASLYDRHYHNADRRAELDGRIRLLWDDLPPMTRFELYKRMVAAAARHDDEEGARKLVDGARKLVADHGWPPESAVSLLGEVAKLRALVGQKDQAGSEISRAVELFEMHRDRIIDIERASALLPLAEASHAIGDTERAMSLYGKALDEAVVNPNSRPRAENLSTICRSLALHGVEPTDALRDRIHAIRKGFGDPW